MRLLIILIITSLISSTTFAWSAKVEQEAADWRNVAETIPLGSKVRVQRLGGDRVSGTLMRVDDHMVLVKRDSRRPEPAITIAYAEMSRLERCKEGGGVNVVKAIAIGAAAGAGAIVTMILFALQLD